jgi:hypothetical protein
VNIEFFEDPDQIPRAREDVRFKQLGIFVHDDRRRVAVGFNITPFLERPSIQLQVKNERDEAAAALTVVETIDTQFSLTLHLRDHDPTNVYRVQAVLYYLVPDRERIVVDRVDREFDLRRAGEQ